MKLAHPISAISFDIDHTLIDFDAVLENSLQCVSDAVLSKFSVEVSTVQLADIGVETAKTYKGNPTEFLKIRKQSFHNFLQSQQLDIGYTDDLFHLFIDERFRKTIFMPGAEELLSNIPQGLKVAVLSNGNSDPNRLGFAQYFDEILVGHSLEEKKPHKGAFTQLMSTLKMSAPKRILHIGDSLHDDIGGAYRAGCQSGWFNPKNEDNGEMFAGDFQASNLLDILTIIEANYTK